MQELRGEREERTPRTGLELLHQMKGNAASLALKVPGCTLPPWEKFKLPRCDFRQVRICFRSAKNPHLRTFSTDHQRGHLNSLEGTCIAIVWLERGAATAWTQLTQFGEGCRICTGDTAAREETGHSCSIQRSGQQGVSTMPLMPPCLGSIQRSDEAGKHTPGSALHALSRVSKQAQVNLCPAGTLRSTLVRISC